MGNIREHKHGKALGLCFYFFFLCFVFVGRGGERDACVVKRRVYSFFCCCSRGIGLWMEYGSSHGLWWAGNRTGLLRLHACIAWISLWVVFLLALLSSRLRSCVVVLGFVRRVASRLDYVLDLIMHKFAFGSKGCYHGRWVA